MPVGTHDIKKYVTPDELTNELAQVGCNVDQIVGMNYNLLNGKWNLMDPAFPKPLLMNYILVATKVV